MSAQLDSAPAHMLVCHNYVELLLSRVTGSHKQSSKTGACSEIFDTVLGLGELHELGENSWLSVPKTNSAIMKLRD